MTETTVRITTLSEDERIAIQALSSQERKEALVRAGQVKMRNTDKRLFQEFLDRVQRGDVGIWINDPDTQRPYPTNGRIVYYRDGNEPMTDIGRVPEHEGMHVCRKRDGSLFFTGGYHLREEGEEWEDFMEMAGYAE